MSYIELDLLHKKFETCIQKFEKYIYRWNFDILKPFLESPFNTHYLHISYDVL